MSLTTGQAPKHITWVICLVLYIIALIASFGIIRLPANLGQWAWIIGFALLLIAVKVRGL